MILGDIHRNSVYLMVTMILAVIIALGIGITILYNAGFQEERQRLVETVQSQARLMEAVARFGKEHSGEKALQVTLGQIREAHGQFKGFGNTGEFTLAKLEGNQIVFLLNHRHDDMNNLRPVPFDANNAEPMRLALQGKSGTVVGLDYRGETVLAAYEPVAELNLGIVAKIDLKEIRAPFVRAAWLSFGITVIIVFAGLLVFQRITKAGQKKIETAIKGFSGIIPLCAWCGTKIKDDNGEWVNLETYFDSHTDAMVSHGMCPKCAENFSKSIES